MSERVSTTKRLADALRAYLTLDYTLAESETGIKVLHDPLKMATKNARAALAAHDAAQTGGEVGNMGNIGCVCGGTGSCLRCMAIRVLHEHLGNAGVALLTGHAALACGSGQGIFDNSTDAPPPASQPAKQGEGECRHCYGSGKDTSYYGPGPVPSCPDCATHPAQATIKDEAAQAVAGGLAAEFETFVKTLPIGAQQNVREAIERSESVTFDAFKFGRQLATAIRASRGEGL